MFHSSNMKIYIQSMYSLYKTRFFIEIFPLNLTSDLLHTRVQRVTSQLIQKATSWCRSITPTGEVMPLFPFRATFFDRAVLFSMVAGNELFYTRWWGKAKVSNLIKYHQILSKPILASTCFTSSQTSVFSLSLHSSPFLLLWQKQLKLYSRYSYYIG